MRLILCIICIQKILLLIAAQKVSEFAVADINGLCVFGTVEKLPQHFVDRNHCHKGGCQVAVGLHEVFLQNSIPKHPPNLLLSIEAKGQSLHTLSKIYLTVKYPDNYVLTFRVSISNLNGHHTDLLKDIFFTVPLDQTKMKLNSNRTISLEVKSECSCSGFKDQKKFVLSEILEMGPVIDRNSCYSSQERESFWGSHLVIKLITMAAIILIVIFCLPLALLFLLKRQVQKRSIERSQCMKACNDRLFQEHGEFIIADFFDDCIQEDWAFIEIKHNHGKDIWFYTELPASIIFSHRLNLKVLTFECC